MDHLAILPIVLPLFAGGLLALIDDRHHTAKLAINIAASGLLVVISLLLLADVASGSARISVYQLGSWPAPYGIVLVVDPLSALMVALTAALALGTVIFSAARWHRAGQHFNSLFQLLLMGLNGAFLTGDLFNLFVFFEVLLAASYGLALHGSGRSRVKASLHYVAVNLASSSLFLIGATAIYGVAGTLNMADLATRVPLLAPGEQTLFQTGAALLGVAFLVKAGMWPLGMWLPTTYAAAAPPVAAMFAILSKVGVYVILRLSSVLFGDTAGTSAVFGGLVLLYGGLATIAFGTVGVLASQGVARIACFSVMVSSGTLLTMIGFGDAGVTAGALYYLIGSTLGLACLFLLVELMERGRSPGDDVLAITLEAYGDDDETEHREDMGKATPASFAALGIAFVCCVILVSGMPPLAGFLGKFAMISAILDLGRGSGAGVSGSIWLTSAVLIISGLAATIALIRIGINTFWVSLDGVLPAVRMVEVVPIALFLLLGILMTIWAQPVMSFIETATTTLYTQSDYVDAVLTDAEVGQR